MSLLHPALLSGLGLAFIPILLHLMLRAKPKRLVFPALRLIKQSRRQNVRRLQLRHLWLLLLRVLVITLIVFALTRPSLPAANYSLVWYEWAALFFVVGLGLGAYLGVLAWWKRRNWSRSRILTQRTILRGGVGIATVLLLLLGVGWPYIQRVSAEIKSPMPKAADNIPVAAIFLFDTSPSMSYRQGNQTRLQFAQQIARDHLSRLPNGSKVAVTGLHDTSPPAFSLDLQAARTRIDAQEIKAVGMPLNDQLRTMLLAQEDDRRRVTAEQTGPEEKRQDRYLREIYVFTDLTKSAWRDETSTVLRDELKRLETIGIYLIDVGETAPNNVGITSIRMARETIPSDGTLKMDVVVSAAGNVKPDQTLELFTSGPDGKMVKTGQKPVTVEPGAEKILTFEKHNIVARYLQGEVRIAGSDPLAIDDVAYFTVQTLPQLKILIVAEKKEVAEYWQSVLNVLAELKNTEFQTEFRHANSLSTSNFAGFDVVCLINVSAPDNVAWTKLRSFVEAGGGLSVFLGADSSAASQKQRTDLINPVFYTSDEARRVLPAELKATLNHNPAQTMDLRNVQHPLLKRIDDFSLLADLGAIEIRKSWKVEPYEDSIVVAKFSHANGSPVLIERRIGQGRVMLLATGIDNEKWSDLVATRPSYMVFADQLMQYLSQQASLRCNYVLGNEVTLPLDRERKLKKVVIRMPDFKQRPQEIAAESKVLSLRDLTSVGSYQVDSIEGKIDYHTGFSLNLAARECDLQRLLPSELDSLLGEGRYTVNRDPGSLERNVQAGRLGQEVYGIVVAFLVAVFSLEQFTATWFYRTDEA